MPILIAVISGCCAKTACDVTVVAHMAAKIVRRARRAPGAVSGIHVFGVDAILINSNNLSNTLTHCIGADCLFIDNLPGRAAGTAAIQSVRFTSAAVNNLYTVSRFVQRFRSVLPPANASTISLQRTSQESEKIWFEIPYGVQRAICSGRSCLNRHHQTGRALRTQCGA